MIETSFTDMFNISGSTKRERSTYSCRTLLRQNRQASKWKNDFRNPSMRFQSEIVSQFKSSTHLYLLSITFTKSMLLFNFFYKRYTSFKIFKFCNKAVLCATGFYFMVHVIQTVCTMHWGMYIIYCQRGEIW